MFGKRSGIAILACICACCFNAVKLTAADLPGVQRFGGVEIGGKGIKVAAIEIDTSGPKPSIKELPVPKVTDDTSISELSKGKFNPKLIPDIARVVADRSKMLQDKLGIPPANVRVVASSGLPYAANFPALQDAIQKATGVDLDRVSPEEEGWLTTIVAIPKDQYKSVVLIDIGSGNTKGGAFLDDSGQRSQFLPITVGYGTVTLGNEIKAALKDNAGRAAVVQDVSQKLVGDPLKKQFDEAKPKIGKRTVILSGGAAWSFATFAKPDTATMRLVPVKAEEIRAYADSVRKAGKNYPAIALDAVKDEAARAKAQADYNKITGATGEKPTFTPENLESAAALLERLSEAADFEHSEVFFRRDLLTAWLSAKITPAEYQHLWADQSPPETPPVKPVPPVVATPKPENPVVPAEHPAEVAAQKIPDPPAAPATASATSPAVASISSTGSASIDPIAMQIPEGPNAGYPASDCGCCGAAPCCPQFGCPSPGCWGCSQPCYPPACGGYMPFRFFRCRRYTACCGCCGCCEYSCFSCPTCTVQAAHPVADWTVSPAYVAPSCGCSASVSIPSGAISFAPPQTVATPTYQVAASASLPPAPMRNTTVVTHNPQFAQACFSRGFHAYWNGDYTTARDRFEQAIAADPGDARFWYYKGLTERRLGQGGLANDSISRGATLETADPTQHSVVSTAIERIQGSDRQCLRKAVNDAQIAALAPKPLNLGVAVQSLPVSK